MTTYFDSSVILSILLRDTRSKTAVALWQEHHVRLTSFLTELECVTTLRRVRLQYRASLPVSWLTEMEAELSNFLEEVSIHKIDESVCEKIRYEKKLEGCRTLDTIHLGTALLFKDAADAIEVCTFDKKMARLAKELGFPVVPENE